MKTPYTKPSRLRTRWLLALLCMGSGMVLPSLASAQDVGISPAWVGDGIAGDTVHVAPPTGEAATDRASVQAALDAVRPRDIVQFAPGMYRLGAGARLTVPDVTVLGHPAGTTLRGCDPEAFDVAESEVMSVVFGCTGLYVQAERQTIRGLTFEYAWHGIVVGPFPTTAEEAATLGPDGPALYPTGGHRIEGNTFRATPNGLRVLGTGDGVSVVRDNDFVDVFHAIGIYGAPLHFVGNRVTVEDPARVPFSRHPGSAVLVMPGHTDCSGHVVAGNRIEGYPDPIYVSAAPGSTCRGVEVRDNTIRAARVRVPEAWGGSVLTEGDSTMVGVPITLRGTTPGKGEPTGEPEPPGVLEEIVVRGNRIEGAEGLGILVQGATRSRIEGNTITGIQRRSPFPGITWDGEGQVWGEANGSGIWLSPGSDGNEIAGNTFEDVAASAVVVEGDSNRVTLEDPDDAVHDLGAGNRVGRFVGERHGFQYGSPKQAGASAERLAGLSLRVADWVREGAIVGGEILVVKDDRILLHDVVGWGDREAGTPLRLNSVYHVASMTKPFLGTAVLMLVEEGRIELDQPVSDILPSFGRPDVRAITVRHLLTHTAGWANEGAFPDDLIRGVPDLRTLVDSIATRGPAYAPGQAYRYGDAHSWILGAIVEAVSGVSSDRFIEERILKPLGLIDTRMGFRREHGWAERVNRRYRRGPDGWIEYWDPADAELLPFFRAAGGAYSTALDYAAWLRAWVGLLDGAADGPERLISAPLAHAAVTKGPLHPEYGLHWYIYGDAPLVFGHGGSDGTRAWAVPSEHLIVVYLTQSRGHDTLGEFGRLALDAATPGLRMRTRLPEVSAGELGYDLRAVGSEEAKEFLGDYAVDGEWIRVRWEDGRFGIDPDFWAPYDLASIGGGRFVMVSRERGAEPSIAGPAVQIEFQTASSGEMTLRVVRVDGDAVELEAIRRR